MNVIRAAAAIFLVGLLAPPITIAAEPPTAGQAERDKMICGKTLEVPARPGGRARLPGDRELLISTWALLALPPRIVQVARQTCSRGAA